MKYEKPVMEIEQMEDADIIRTSLTDGGTSGEGNGPGIDFGGTGSTQF